MTINAEGVASIRSRLGKTQEEMAALCGVTVRTWRRWETGGASEMVGKFLTCLAREGAEL